MDNTDHLVSIILPVQNSARFLEVCLESLISQSYKNLEIIAIDDFSKDSSWKILRKFKKLDKRIRIYKNKKKYGLAICLNRAIKRAKGEFITFMNPNDSQSKFRIKKQVNYLLENPRLIGAGTQVANINNNNKKLSKTLFPKENAVIYNSLPTRNSLLFESVLINKRNIPKDILKFIQKPYPFIFTEVFMKLFRYGEFANLEDPLYFRRKVESELDKIEHAIAFTRVFLKSIALYDYKPSLRTLLFPLAKQNV